MTVDINKMGRKDELKHLRRKLDDAKQLLEIFLKKYPEYDETLVEANRALSRVYSHGKRR